MIIIFGNIRVILGKGKDLFIIISIWQKDYFSKREKGRGLFVKGYREGVDS